MLTGLRRASRSTAVCVVLLAAIAGCQSHTPSRPSALMASVSPARITTSAPKTYPTCAARQVSLTYRGGGFGTGNNFGVIVLANVGEVTCEVLGLRLTVSPVDDAGRGDRDTTGLGRRCDRLRSHVERRWRAAARRADTAAGRSVGRHPARRRGTRRPQELKRAMCTE